MCPKVWWARTSPVPDALGNSANPDKIANPDNLKYSEAMRTLFIGEDSGNHVNNFLWAYNVDTKQLSRILSCPAGAESTGLHAVDDLNGFSYIMSNFQHPATGRARSTTWSRPALEPLGRRTTTAGSAPPSATWPSPVASSTPEL